jgi:hypothetical protein
VPPDWACSYGISDRLWDMADIVKLVDDEAPPEKKRGPYQKRISD